MLEAHYLISKCACLWLKKRLSLHHTNNYVILKCNFFIFSERHLSVNFRWDTAVATGHAHINIADILSR